MVNSVAIISVFVLAISAGPESLYIERGGVGCIEIGDSVESLISERPDRVSRVSVDRIDSRDAFQYSFNDDQSVILEVDDEGDIWAIRITTSSVMTKESVGVGSVYSDVMEVYPNAELSYGAEDGGYISLYVDDINGFFSFDISDIDGSILGQELEVQRLQDRIEGLKVEVVIIHGL